MSENSRYEYFRVLAERYRNETKKKQRSQIINEACKNTGLHRKSVIRAFWRYIVGHQKFTRPGRPRKFSEGAIFALKRLYRESDFQCSGKLYSMIPILIEQLNLQLAPEVIVELKSISPASIERYLKKYRQLHSVKKEL